MSTITFTCYSCTQVLKVGADKAGRKAKCIKCGTILTIPATSAEAPVAAAAVTPAPGPAPPPPVPKRREDDDEPRKGRRADEDEDDRPRKRGRDEDDDYDDDGPRKRRRDEEDDYDDDRPRKRRRDEDNDYDDERPRRSRRDEDDDRDERPRRRRDVEDDDRPRRKWGDWSKVGVGMTLHMICGGVLAGAAGIGLLSLLLLSIAGLMSQPPVWLLKAGIIIGAIGAITFFAVAIPAIIAYVFCLFTPNKRGAMAWAIVVLSVGGVSLVLRIIWTLIPAINSFSILSGRGDAFGAGLAMFNSVLQIPIIPIGGGGGRFGEPSVAGTIIVSILILVVMYAEYVLLQMYMKAASGALGDRYIGSEAVLPLVCAATGVGLKLVGLLVGFIGLESVRSAGGAKAVGIIVVILMLLAHTAFVVYGLSFLQLSFKARQAIFSRMSQKRD